jgi:lipopolysaccharide/colanic/teichoic acid biosynthesis glycosyltransferase
LVYKFRTMTVCEDGSVVAQATPQDHRVTLLEDPARVSRPGITGWTPVDSPRSELPPWRKHISGIE